MTLHPLTYAARYARHLHTVSRWPWHLCWRLGMAYSGRWQSETPVASVRADLRYWLG